MRINKYLTEANFCSRREADRLVAAGRVFINGQQATLGQQVTDGDAVRVDQKKIEPQSKKIYLAYNKPVGVICTTSAKEHNNIIDAIGYPSRIYPIGRLDVASSGLILLTNDGSVVNDILKSHNNVEKEYVAEVEAEVTGELLKGLARGVVFDGKKSKPANVTRLSAKRLRIVITEGRNRQVRKMCTALGFRVTRLHRTRVGGIRIGDLREGEWREISLRDR